MEPDGQDRKDPGGAQDFSRNYSSEGHKAFSMSKKQKSKRTRTHKAIDVIEEQLGPETLPPDVVTEVRLAERVTLRVAARARIPNPIPDENGLHDPLPGEMTLRLSCRERQIVVDVHRRATARALVRVLAAAVDVAWPDRVREQ